MRIPSGYDPSSWVTDQGTHLSSSHTYSSSGGSVPHPMHSLSCCVCRRCMRLFVQTPPLIARWLCSLLLVVASWTPSSCWGGWLEPPCSWGTGRHQAGSCWIISPWSPQTSYCFPPPIACMQGIDNLLLPLLPHADAIAHYSGCWVMGTAIWDCHPPKPLVW